jgi:L-arabinokinase
VIELGAIYRQAAIDAGVVQPLAYTVDRQKTIENLYHFIGKRADILSTEIDWLKSIQADCVLCDAPFLPW